MPAPFGQEPQIFRNGLPQIFRNHQKAIPTSKSSAGTHLEECVTSATEYFEWFGAEWSIDEPE